MNSKLNSMSSKLVDNISGKVAEKWFKELRLCNFLFVLVMMMMCLYQCVKGWV